MARKWSLEDDMHLWSVVGDKPRTASGGLSTAGGVGALIKQMAARFGRTEGAITSRFKHLVDPSHSAYQRLRVPRLDDTDDGDDSDSSEGRTIDLEFPETCPLCGKRFDGTDDGDDGDGSEGRTIDLEHRKPCYMCDKQAFEDWAFDMGFPDPLI